MVEYWRFDHTGGDCHDAALAGDRLLSPGVYQPIEITLTPEGVYRGYSAALALELHWVAGELRFWNPATGDYVPDIAEHRMRRETAEAAHLATADQLEAAIIDRDANAARAVAAETQLAAAQELIQQLQVQRQQQQ